MANGIFIQDRFTLVDPETKYSFSDALVLPKSDYDALAPEHIEALKQERFTAWKDAVANPVVIPEPSKEEQLASLEKDIASLDDQKAMLLSQKAVVQADVAVKAQVEATVIKGK